MVDTDSSVLERRSSIRVKDSFPTQIQFINGEKREAPATVENMSEGGLCVATNFNKSKVKKEAYLKVDLPGYSSSLDIAAVVVWTKAQGKDALMVGLKFAGIPTTTQSHINKYIQSRIQTQPLRRIKKSVFKRASLNKLSERERRNLIILDAMRKKGPLSKAQVSQIADLNIGTITNYVDDYIGKSLVLETGLDVSSGGRRPTLLELNPRYGFCIGIDVSNNKKGLAVLVCDINGSIINKYLSASKSAEDFKINNIISRVSSVIKSSLVPQENLLGMGVAVSGNSEENFSDLSEALEREFNVPVLIENASCANLFAERTMSPSLDELGNILYFSLLNSDCSLVINGDIYRINSKFSINLKKVVKSNLRNNCWEKENNCILKPLPEYNPEDIKALSWDLGLRLSVLINLLRPEVIILGDAEDRELIRDLLPDIKDKVKNWSINGQDKAPVIILGHLGKESTALGAALLVSREIFIQA